MARPTGNVLVVWRGELFVQAHHAGISVLDVAADFDRHRLPSHSSYYLRVVDVLEWHKRDLKNGKEIGYSSAALDECEERIKFFTQELKKHKKSKRETMPSD